MKNFHIFTLLAAGLFLAAAIATYQPSTHTSGGSLSYHNSYQIHTVPDKAEPQLQFTTPVGVSSDSAHQAAGIPLPLTPAFSYTIGKVRLSGDEGTRPFPAELSVTELTAATLPPLDQGMVNVTDYAAGYRMLPDGMVFNGDISIVLPYDSTLLPAGFTPDDIVTYYYDVPSGRWMSIPRDSVSTAEALVYSKVNHFTDFINAIIKTPEMPETSAFTPTSIKELEAANPLEGLQLIQAPTANNSGTANLSYQLEIPAGRQGMQPNLALTYSSNGGNGWLGVGWDISVPSITVETRWGVPRYDYQKESEVYVYGGEQLVEKDAAGNHLPMPHRTNQWRQRTSSTRFYPRTDEAFDSIIRHGSTPQDYWWEAVDRNGITYYYGKKHDSEGVDYNSVLRDNSGNIASWALTEMSDPHKNRVLYSYDVVNSTGMSSNSSNYGRQIYLKEIRYTDFSDNQGKYRILFQRHGGRADVSINAQYGFKQVTASTLCSVHITYETDTIRSYYFGYENGYQSNYKTRLTDVVRVDGGLKTDYGCGDPISQLTSIENWKGTRTHFDYFDAPVPDSLFAPATEIHLQDDGVHSNFIASAFNNNGDGKATALGATKGRSWSLGGNVGVGLGGNVALSTISAGGNFDYSQSESEGALTLIDLDGDGLADKVYKTNEGIFFCKQIPGINGHFSYGIPQLITGITDFLKESSHTITWGLQASAGCSLSGAWPTTTSTTSVYFADVNADGLPDLITESGVLFNVTENGDSVKFKPFYTIRTENSGNVDPESVTVNSTTPCGGIIFDGEVSDSIACGIDWVLDTIIRNLKNNSPDFAYFDSLLNTGEYDYHYDEHRSVLYLYRKVIRCEPEILDPDLDAVRVWIAPKSGSATLQSVFQLIEDTSANRRQSQYANGVRYTIQRNRGNHALAYRIHSTDTAELYDMTVPDSVYTKDSISLSLELQEGDILFFRQQSRGNRSFDRSLWHQRIVYDTDTTHDRYGMRSDIYDSREDFFVCGKDYYKTHTYGTATATADVSIGNISDTVLLFCLDSNHNVLGDTVFLLPGPHQSVQLFSGLAVDSACEMHFIAVIPDSVSYGEIEIAPKVEFSYIYNPVGTAFTDPISDTLTVYPSVNLTIDNYRYTALDSIAHLLFGPLYRGWGQFAYNNHSYPVTDPIRIELLNADYLQSTAVTDSAHIFATPSIDSSTTQNELENSFSADSMFNPLAANTCWVEMLPDCRHQSWNGYGNITFIDRTTISNTRLPQYVTVEETADMEDYDFPIPQPDPTYGMVKTIRKQNRSKLGNYSLSLGIPIVPISVGLSESNGENTILTDYMDLNGDRYPDFVGEAYVQYSTPWGGIGDVQPLDANVQKISSSLTSSEGETFGASFSMPTRQSSNNQKKAKISFDGQGSIGASHGGGTDQTSYTFMDINGDGLPDKLNSAGRAALNVGYGFLPFENWRLPGIRNGKSENEGMSLGGAVNIAQASISGGLGVNKSENTTTGMLADFNGDGLPDYIYSGSGFIDVSYNLGNGQWSDATRYNGLNHVSYSTSYSESANIGVTAGFTFLGSFKFIIGVQTSPVNRSFSKDRVQIVDVDGDGCPDYVTSPSEDVMSVRYNRSGKTNLLKKVTNFTGSTVELDYELSAASFNSPQRQWNLAETVVSDSLSHAGGDTARTTFSYHNPYYNRYERIGYGYDSVTTRQHNPDGSVYRYTAECFDNQHFNKRGKKTYDCIYDADGNKYVETFYFATMVDMVTGDTVGDADCPSVVYPGFEAEIRNYYEALPSPQITTAVTRQYDSRRNIIRYINWGDTSHRDEYFMADIRYATGMGNNLISLPTEIVVKNYDGDTLQRRSTSYDTNGKMTSLRRYSDNNNYELFEYDYDMYGNVDRVHLPYESISDRMWTRYTYDAQLHTYPVTVHNALGYTSTTTYDYRIGKPLSITDLNGNTMSYEYDAAGRLVRLKGPNEGASVPYTILMEYHPRGYGHDAPTYSYAVTSHYDIQHPDDPIQTILYCDGLGRMIQTKKDAEVEDEPMHIVSGKVVYDCFGRTVAQYHPVVEPLENMGYNQNYVSSTLTATSYDVLDRPLKVVLPTNDSTITEYGFGTHSGKTYFRTTAIDPNGIAITTLTGTRKQQIKTVAPCNAVTTFTYDPLGQLKTSTDPCHYTTSYTYDMLGRMTQRVHPDAGTDTYLYDGAGNMVKHATQVLAIAGETVNYYYSYNRLDSIIYPINPQNNVRYTYGDSTAGNNQRGRIALMEDASGFQTFFYGKMGEVTENNRTFVLPNESYCYSFKMKYAYDSWNRVQTITYPDGEVVYYKYNTGGMLDTVYGQRTVSNMVPKGGSGGTIGPIIPIIPSTTYTYHYINHTTYNEFELKSRQWYGNGSYSQYTYDTLQRLKTLKLNDGTTYHRALQDITYNYDAVGNIASIHNGAAMYSSMGATYTYTYKYDSLYRIDTATGYATAGTKNASYSLIMQYRNDGSILNKSQGGRDYLSGYLIDYWNNYSYTYHTGQPHTVQSVGGSNYLWDANGNVAQTSSTTNSSRIYSVFDWDEENRLRHIDMPYTNKCVYYKYDAGGERFYKNVGSRTNMTQNGQPYVYREYNDPTLYASPYVVVTPTGYTKHYFVETERFASRIGDGNITGLNSHATNAAQLAAKRQEVNGAIPGSISNGQFEGLRQLQAHWSTHHTTYWLHPDHLGSTNWVTDTIGRRYQHMLYKPWGELFVSQPTADPANATRYTFSGKERDEETGYSYFGSRYYNSSLSIWLSVDPMSDKYPSTSPYTYCGNNPVRLVDPDGREIRIYYKEKQGFARLFEKRKYYVYTPGSSYDGENDYVSETVKALNYVSAGDQKNVISTLADDKHIFKIKEGKFDDEKYSPLTRTITFNPHSGLKVLDDNGNPTGERQTPALGLLHELGHAFVKLTKAFVPNFFNNGDDQYDNKEDAWIIKNIETPAAKILNEGIRYNHDGDAFKAKNSTSMEDYE